MIASDPISPKRESLVSLTTVLFAALQASVGVLDLEQRRRRQRQNVKVEQHRPILDVVEIVLDALLDLLARVRLAAPTIDLRPARHSRFYFVTREVVRHDFGIEPVVSLRRRRMRAWSDQRQIPHDDVEELR